MLYAIKLGPIESQEDDDCFAYVGFTERHAFPPTLEKRDADGLRGLLQYAEGQELRCEPGMARVGEKLGFKPGPMPVWVMEGRGFLAYGMALGPYGAKIDKNGLPQLFATTASFVKSQPWQWWTDSDPLSITVMGSAGKRYEGCVMGAASEEFGLVLYEQPGAIKRIAAYMTADDFKAASVEPFLSLTLNFEPGWATEAVNAAYGTWGIPWPMNRTGGKATRLDATTLAILSAALEATSHLTPRNLLETAEAKLPKGRIKVTVEAPAVRVA